MIAFLISLAPFIPTILSLVAFLMKWFGRSEQTIKDYEAMVKRLANTPILSVASHDKHMANKEAILAELKAEEEAKKKADSAPKQP